MNAYFDKNECFDSNKGIIEAYFGESVKSTGAWDRMLELVSHWVAILLSVLTSDLCRRITKALSVAVCLVCFVGIIGAMERGTLGLGSGVCIGLLLLCIEVLCLRPRYRK